MCRIDDSRCPVWSWKDTSVQRDQYPSDQRQNPTGDSADGNLLEASGCLVGPDSHVCDKRSYICMRLLLGGEKNRGIIFIRNLFFRSFPYKVRKKPIDNHRNIEYDDLDNKRNVHKRSCERC